MKEIRKEIGSRTFTELKLLESAHLQLDSGRLDEWLASQERSSGMFDPVAEPLMRRLNWQARYRRKEQPWLRRLLFHRGGDGQ